jgi:Aspartyl/Asparaginyl beta-hydroxylase
MRESARLALRFDAERLLADLSRLSSGAWTPHFNASFFEGDWSGIALRASASDRGLSAGAAASESFTGTEALAACSYFQEVLAAFRCPLKSVRLLRLAPGSIIREHSDFDLGEELGEVRLHVPVATNSQVEFYLAGKRVVMDAGECWYLDLSLPHRVQNRGANERVHLVLDCVLNQWLRDLIRSPQAGANRAAATTGAAAFQQFTQTVFAHPELRLALRDIHDLEEFLRATVRHGEKHDLYFTTEDVRAAWRAGAAQRPSRAS